jgi:hypothetical protein
LGAPVFEPVARKIDLLLRQHDLQLRVEVTVDSNGEFP